MKVMDDDSRELLCEKSYDINKWSSGENDDEDIFYVNGNIFNLNSINNTYDALVNMKKYVPKIMNISFKLCDYGYYIIPDGYIYNEKVKIPFLPFYEIDSILSFLDHLKNLFLDIKGYYTG